MKIVTWNCNMAFGRKRDLIMALDPDILILQEVSKKDIEETKADFKHWVGTNPHKGLAIIAFGEHEYRLSDLYTDDLPWFIPLEIADLNLHILGVWAHVKNPQLRYVRVIHAAIEHYQSFIHSAPTIIAGDFNSNTIWDKLHAESSHTPLVAKLNAFGLKSVYHEVHDEEQGKELLNTQYMYRHRDKGYHIDYMFIPSQFVGEITLRIGEPDEWLLVSDHMPLIAEISQ
jgi:endonuclease/exonuclease/phosphatase family metal-dependent hydrolase